MQTGISTTNMAGSGGIPAAACVLATVCWRRERRWELSGLPRGMAFVVLANRWCWERYTVDPRLSEPHLSESLFIQTHKFGGEYHYVVMNIINVAESSTFYSLIWTFHLSEQISRPVATGVRISEDLLYTSWLAGKFSQLLTCLLLLTHMHSIATGSSRCLSAARSLTCRDDLDSKWRLLLAENELSHVSLLSRNFLTIQFNNSVTIPESRCLNFLRSATVLYFRRHNYLWDSMCSAMCYLKQGISAFHVFRFHLSSLPWSYTLPSLFLYYCY